MANGWIKCRQAMEQHDRKTLRIVSREGSVRLPPPRDCKRDEIRRNATVTLDA